MKILVFSDSHSYTDFMVACTRRIQPDVLIHLGDFLRDAEVLSAEFPNIPLYAVPGNCDGMSKQAPVALIELDGVRFFLTHGHKHGVQYDLNRLKADAKRAGVNAVLYGHTHERYVSCQDGMWLMNPGFCGLDNPKRPMTERSALLIVIENGKISRCAPVA